MSDIIMKIQNIELQLKNIGTQIDCLYMQINNVGFSNVSSQIKFMGIQMLNIGIQMLNIGFDSQNNPQNISNNEQNLKSQIRNIKLQLENIEMKMDIPLINPMLNPMNSSMNMMMPMNNNMMNQGMQMQMPNFDDFNNNLNEPEPEKYNIVFESNKFGNVNLIIEEGTTINDMLENYLENIGKSNDLNMKNKIRFIYNAKFLKFGDLRNIETIFVSTLGIVKVEFLN